jgi:ketosteroid isomerase-like protein
VLMLKCWIMVALSLCPVCTDEAISLA